MTFVVEDGTGRGGGAATVATLNNDTFFDFTATLVNAAAIDSAAELANYDVVILGGSGFNDADWSVAMANALAAWANAGSGGLVFTGWGNYDLNTGAADVILEPLLPRQNGPSTNEYFANIGGVIDINATPHAVTAGIPDFAPGATYTEVNTLIEAGDIILATTVGSPTKVTVSIRDNLGGNGGRSVYLGPIYLALTTQYSTGSLRSGYSDQLLEQATCWAANECAPTESQGVPAPGALALVGLGLLGLGGLRRRA
jgi:MYXO-CTERM domain-containing protein